MALTLQCFDGSCTPIFFSNACGHSIPTYMTVSRLMGRFRRPYLRLRAVAIRSG